MSESFTPPSAFNWMQEDLELPQTFFCVQLNAGGIFCSTHVGVGEDPPFEYVALVAYPSIRAAWLAVKDIRDELRIESHPIKVDFHFACAWVKANPEVSAIIFMSEQHDVLVDTVYLK